MNVPGMPDWQNTPTPNCNFPVFTWFPCGCAPFIINSTNVIYTGDNLPNSLINTNDNLTLALSKIDVSLSSIVNNAVPSTRTITINGLTQDLSADRTWNTITLASFSAGTGISYNNLTGVITNSAPDQTVTLTQGSNITITGTYPNFTISSTGGITNSAIVNELMKSDGTNAVSSGLFSTTLGNLNLGTGISGASRTIQADGSGADVSLSILGKGLGTISLSSNGVTYTFNNTTFNVASSTGSLSNSSGIFVISSASGNPGKAIKLLSGDGASSGQPSGVVTVSSGNGVTTGNSGVLNLNTGTGGNATGDINIITGNATTASGNIFLQTGTGTTRGNISLFSGTGSFGSGQQVTFIHDAAVNPTTNPTAGFIFYSDASNSSHPTIRIPGGSTYDLLAIGNPAGTNTQIQFNNSGSFGASSNLTWDGTHLTVGGVLALSVNVGISKIDATGGTGRLDIQTAGSGSFWSIPGLDISGGDIIIGENIIANKVLTLRLNAANGNYLKATGLPTSSAGLPSGAFWLNSNVLTIVP